MIHLPLSLSIDFLFFFIGFIFVIWLVFRYKSRFNPRYRSEHLSRKQLDRINRNAELFLSPKRDHKINDYQQHAALLNEYRKACKLYDTHQIDRVAFELKLEKLLEKMDLELDFMDQ